MPASRTPRSITLRHAVDVEVTPERFVPFQSLRTLDLDRLARSRHELVELGQFDGGCCKRTARAVVKRGKVTEITLDACSDENAKVKVTPELGRLMARARAKLKRSGSPSLRLPMPVSRFFARDDGGGIITIDLSANPLCWRNCINFPVGPQVCIFCCTAFLPNGQELTNCVSIVTPTWVSSPVGGASPIAKRRTP